MITLFRITSKTDQTVWDIKASANNIKWETDLNFAAGTLSFDLMNDINDGHFKPNFGDIVEFQWDDQKIFYGYIFKLSYSETQKFSVTAYDKLRYFKNQDSIVWPISTISQRFETVAKMAEVAYKIVNGSDYKLNAEVADAKTYFDMLKSAIDSTQKATNQMYYLFANYDVVELRKAPFQELNLIIGDQSLLTGFSYDGSIDEAANVVRIVKKDQEQSQNVSATADTSETTQTEDPSKTSFSYTDASGDTVSRWGKLQVVENAKDKANDAQMKQRADELLKDKNRPTYSLKLTAIGDVSLIPGNSINIKMADLDMIGFAIQNAAFLKSNHNFSSDYTVDLEMKVNEPWLENNSSA